MMASPAVTVLLLLPCVLAVSLDFSSPYGASGVGVIASDTNGLATGAGSSSFANSDPLGRSLGSASGVSSGLYPSSSSVANSVNQAYQPVWKKRDLDAVSIMILTNESTTANVSAVADSPVNAGKPIVRQRRGFDQFGGGGGFGGFGGQSSFFPFGQSAGTAIGSASALQGRSFSSGNTQSHGGFSNSLAQGEAEGLQPVSTSIANSQSSGYNRRRRRQSAGDPSADDVQEQQQDAQNDQADQQQWNDQDNSSPYLYGAYRRKREAGNATAVIIASVPANSTNSSTTVVLSKAIPAPGAIFANTGSKFSCGALILIVFPLLAEYLFG